MAHHLPVRLLEWSKYAQRQSSAVQIFIRAHVPLEDATTTPGEVHFCVPYLRNEALERVLDLAALHGVQLRVELDPLPAARAVCDLPLSLVCVDGIVAGAAFTGVGAIANITVSCQ